MLSRHFIVAGLSLVALAHVFLYGYWVVRSVLPTTLAHTHILSAEQIITRNDPYRTERTFVRRYLRDNRDLDKLVLVTTQASSPTRIHLELLYELYPTTPRSVVVGSAELHNLLADPPTDLVLLSDTDLGLGEPAYKKTVGQFAYIYERQ